MKRRPKKRERPVKVIRLWNWPQAQKALPYLRSVVGSLRDHYLEVQGANLALTRQAQTPGRPDRHALIAQGNALQGKEDAEERFSDALHELTGLDVFLLDPVRGLALIPFSKNDQLAWFIFDQFEPEGIASWRFHEDPLDTRRPLAEAHAESAPAASMA